MEKVFAFSIPNEKRRLYNRIALLIFILNAVGILIRFIYFNSKAAVMPGEILLPALALLTLIYLFFIAYNDRIRKYFKTFLSGSFILCLYWTIAGPWWVAALSLILISTFLIAQRELIIKIDGQQILYPSFPARHIRWDELNNLVFKDGLLTIDFKNDQLIQHYPESKMNLPDEQEFNEFCRKRIGY